MPLLCRIVRIRILVCNPRPRLVIVGGWQCIQFRLTAIVCLGDVITSYIILQDFCHWVRNYIWQRSAWIVNINEFSWFSCLAQVGRFYFTHSNFFNRIVSNILLDLCLVIKMLFLSSSTHNITYWCAINFSQNPASSRLEVYLFAMLRGRF